MNFKILYEDSDVLAVDKPAGVVVFPEGEISGEKTLIDWLLEKYPDLKNVGEAPRYGMVHRLDKDTSGVLLVAKTAEALIFLQKQFKNTTTDSSVFPSLARGRKNDVSSPPHSLGNRTVSKKYVALATGVVKDDQGVIHTLIGRSKSDPRKQTAHSLEYTGKTGLREAITDYKVLQRFDEYTLLEVQIKTGRKHQIRCHLAYLRHPIAGDKIYGFKDSPTPEGLERQFLHAGYLKIVLPNGEAREFNSELPEDLQKILINLGTKK